MTFQSLDFFLPIDFVIYWIACRKSAPWQNGLIVAASLVFYGWYR